MFVVVLFCFRFARSELSRLLSANYCAHCALPVCLEIHRALPLLRVRVSAWSAISVWKAAPLRPRNLALGHGRVRRDKVFVARCLNRAIMPLSRVAPNVLPRVSSRRQFTPMPPIRLLLFALLFCLINRLWLIREHCWSRRLVARHKRYNGSMRQWDRFISPTNWMLRNWVAPWYLPTVSLPPNFLIPTTYWLCLLLTLVHCRPFIIAAFRQLY